MLPWQWILMAAVAAALVILGVLVLAAVAASTSTPVSYTHLRAHETRHDLVCRLLLEKKKKYKQLRAHETRHDIG